MFTDHVFPKSYLNDLLMGFILSIIKSCIDITFPSNLYGRGIKKLLNYLIVICIQTKDNSYIDKNFI